MRCRVMISSSMRVLQRSVVLQLERLYCTLSTRVSVSSSELVPPAPFPQASVSSPPPPGTTGEGDNNRLRGEGAGGANSDDWRESLALICGSTFASFEVCEVADETVLNKQTKISRNFFYPEINFTGILSKSDISP
jgi:hypothetical protein